MLALPHTQFFLSNEPKQPSRIQWETFAGQTHRLHQVTQLRLIHDSLLWQSWSGTNSSKLNCFVEKEMQHWLTFNLDNQLSNLKLWGEHLQSVLMFRRSFISKQTKAEIKPHCNGGTNYCRKNWMPCLTVLDKTVNTFSPNFKSTLTMI